MKIKRYLDDSPLCTLDRVHRTAISRANTAIATFGVGLQQGLVLIAIFTEKRPVGPSELSKLFGTSKAAMGQTISRLEELGYVKRSIAPQDARRILIEVLPGERARVQRLMNVFQRLQSSYEDNLGLKAIKTLQEGMEKLK